MWACPFFGVQKNYHFQIPGSAPVYVGYKKDVQVLHPVTEKVKGMKKALIPRNVTELKSHLGFQNLNIVATFAAQLLLKHNQS